MDPLRLGEFVLDQRQLIHELYGMPTYAVASGRSHRRTSPTTLAAERRNIQILENAYFTRLGKIYATEEPLIQARAKAHGGRTRYRHAGHVVEAMQKHFVQVPIEPLRVDVRLMGMMLGVAKL